MSRNKNRPLPPRRLRMNRRQRLQSAKHWIKAQAGRTAVQIAKSYKNWFGVDWPCAIQELEILGIRPDSHWVAQLYCSLEGARKARAQRREHEAVDSDVDSDEHFAYIAGYTPGGAPFGITWEEQRQHEAEERQSSEIQD